MRKIEEKHSGGKTVKFYNDKGNLIEEQLYGKILGLFYSLSFTEKYLYDDQNRLYKAIGYCANGDLAWKEEYYYHYSKDGVLLKLVTISERGKDYVNFEYDKKGRVIAENGTLSSGHKYRNEWDYDLKGNKINECHFDC